MRKRAFACIVFFLVCLLLSAGCQKTPPPVDDSEQNTQGLSYFLNDDNTYTVTGIGTATASDVSIPPTYNELPVARIRDNAFSKCKCLTSIKIPASVIKIGSSVFSGCTSLASIQVDSGNKVYHSDGNCLIRTSSKHLVAGCKSSVIPADGSVKSIGDGAFSGCTGLSSVAIPACVKTIGDSAFYGCTGLSAVTIPAGVTKMGSFAFFDCTGLMGVAIPASVRSIGVAAFAGCANLESATFGENSVLTNVGKNAFRGCRSLTSVTIPDGVTHLDSSAFSECINLVSVTVPVSLTHIGLSAFSGCTNLESILFHGTIMQ